MNYLKNFLRSCDIFGIPVTLSYKGNPTFTTIQGGICSIMLAISLVFMISIMMYDEVNSGNFSYDEQTIINSYYENDEMHKIYSSNETLAIALEDWTGKYD